MSDKPAVTLATISESVKPVRTVVSLCVAGDLFAQHERLEAQLEEASGEIAGRGLGGDPAVRKTAEALVALEKKMRAHTHVFTFEKVPTSEALPNGWRSLVDKHPPREGKERIERWHPDTFAPAAVAASCVDPEGFADAEVFAGFWDKLNQGQRAALFDGAYRANEDGTQLPFSVTASAVLSSFAPSSTTAGLAGSR